MLLRIECCAKIVGYSTNQAQPEMSHVTAKGCSDWVGPWSGERGRHGLESASGPEATCPICSIASMTAYNKKLLFYAAAVSVKQEGLRARTVAVR